jgi:hypothetical protein
MGKKHKHLSKKTTKAKMAGDMAPNITKNKQNILKESGQA